MEVPLSAEDPPPEVDQVHLQLDAVKIEFRLGYRLVHVLPVRHMLMQLPQVKRAYITELRQTYLTVKPTDGTSLVELEALLIDLLRPRVVRPATYVLTADIRKKQRVLCVAVVFDEPQNDIGAIAKTINVYCANFLGETVIEFRHPRYIVFSIAIMMTQDVNDPQIRDALRYAGLDTTNREIHLNPRPLPAFMQWLRQKYNLK